MVPLSAAALTALSAPNVLVVQLILIDFSEGAVGLNTSNIDFDYDGVTYKGAYGYGSVKEIQDAPGEIKGLEFTLNGGSADIIALALDNSNTWQGTPITVRTAILGNDYAIVEAPVVWFGTGDTLAISDQDGSTVINATAESSAVDFIRSDPYLYNHADQQRLHPGDKGFELILSQIEKPVVWPSKSWFYK